MASIPTQEAAEGETAEQSVPTTFPEGTMFSMRGIEEESARKLAYNLASCFRILGRHIDVSNLDGVTVAYDYDEALADLDRGYESTMVLTRTTDVGTGVAMTPSVLRDGVLKSHILIHAHVADMIQSEDDDQFKLALYTIAHESAHVEITAAYDRCFPGELLRATHHTLLDACHEQVYSACWDEYAATRISGTFGRDPMPGYEETLILVLGQIDEKVADLVRGFRGGSGEETDAFVGAIFGAYGNLAKFACYFLGTLASFGRKGDPGERILEVLTNSWFRPYYFQIEDMCSALFDEFGEWSNKEGFTAIGGLVEEIVEDRVMNIWRQADGRYSIFVHHHQRNW